MKIVFVEPPVSALRLEGKFLGEVVTNFPKYPQLQLMSNIPKDVETELIDLKTLSPVESEAYKDISYEGKSLECLRIGTSLENACEALTGYDLVGITANYTSERGVITDVVRGLKKKDPHSLVAVGGHDATVCPSYYLERGADFCVLGEGKSIVQNFAAGNLDLKNTRGIAISNSAKPNYKTPKENLAKIKFPSKELLDRYRFNELPDGPFPEGVSSSVAAIETSRGCDEGCSFCDSTYVVGKYRMVPLEALEKKIEVLSESDIKTLIFVDDNLLYRSLQKYGGEKGRSEIIKFFQGLRDGGFSWSFYNGLQIGLLYRDDSLDLGLINSLYGDRKRGDTFEGCFRAYLPLEKFWPDEMSRLPKLLPIEKEMQIIEAISKQRVPHLNLGFIIGNPRETKESLQYSLQSAKEFGNLVVRASDGHSIPRFYPWCSVPIPGTPDARDYLPNIRYDTENFPELYVNYVSVMSGNDFSAHETTIMRGIMDNELNGGNVNRYNFEF